LAYRNRFSIQAEDIVCWVGVFAAFTQVVYAASVYDIGAMMGSVFIFIGLIVIVWSRWWVITCLGITIVDMGCEAMYISHGPYANTATSVMLLVLAEGCACVELFHLINKRKRAQRQWWQH
jgi:hypothetical protein